MNFKEPVETRTPVDFIEPLEETNEYRQACISYLRIVSLAISHCLEADNPTVALYGCAFSLGLISVLGNETMREVGRRLGVSPATISYHSKLFSKKAGLPPSALMKTQEQAELSREARHRYVARGEAAQSIELK